VLTGMTTGVGLYGFRGRSYHKTVIKFRRHQELFLRTVVMVTKQVSETSVLDSAERVLVHLFAVKVSNVA
jgi:hypothetical protein